MRVLGVIFVFSYFGLFGASIKIETMFWGVPFLLFNIRLVHCGIVVL